MTILDEPITLTHLGGLEVRKVKDLQFHFNMLIYGDWGVGKTMLAGSSDEVPEMRKVLFVDMEAGTASLRDYPTIDVVRVTSWPEMEEVYRHLRTGNHPYQTICLDSLTEMQKFNQDQVMKSLVEREPQRDPDIPGLQEWNKSANQLRRIIRAFRDLPYTVIFTALEQQVKDKMGRLCPMPSLPGKLPRELPGHFDYVFRLYLDIHDEQEVRLLRTRRSVTEAAKSREGKRQILPELIGNPTMAGIYKKIRRNEEALAQEAMEELANG